VIYFIARKEKMKQTKRNSIKKKIDELLKKENKREEISELKKKVKDYKRSSGREVGSSLRFSSHLNKLESEYKIQQELRELLTKPIITEKEIAHYKALIKTTEPTKQLVETLITKKKMIDDAKKSETKIKTAIDEGYNFQMVPVKDFIFLEEKSLDKLTKDCEKIREEITIYENNPYKDEEKLDGFLDELLDLEKHFLVEELSNTLRDAILNIWEKPLFDEYRTHIEDSTDFLTIREKKYLVHLLNHSESLFHKKEKASKIIQDEMEKNVFKTKEDFQRFKKIYHSYRLSTYNDPDILVRADAFFVVLQEQFVPPLILEQIKAFLDQKNKIFTRKDVDEFKKMIEDIPLSAFEHNPMKQNELELYQMICSHLIAELQIEKEKKAAEKGQLQHHDVDANVDDDDNDDDNDIIDLNLSSKSTSDNGNGMGWGLSDDWWGLSGNSESDKTSVSIVSKLKKQKKSNQYIRDLLLQQPLRGIPVILISTHGGIKYDDREGICTETFQSPLDVVFRVISTAPGEITTFAILNPEYRNLLNNKIIKNPDSTIIDAINEKKQNTSLDYKINRFRRVGTETSGFNIATNINFKRRNHLIINYRKTEICKKHYSADPNNPDMAVYILNDTDHLPYGTKLMRYKPFLDFLNLPEDLYDYYDIKDRSTKYIANFTNEDILNFLKHLGYKQALILDGSCENNMYKNWPSLSEESENAIAKIQALINCGEKYAGMLMKLVEKWIFREDIVYNTHKKATKKIAKSALKKSTRHRATIAIDTRGKR
jgi:hypothetical protein